MNLLGFMQDGRKEGGDGEMDIHVGFANLAFFKTF